MAYPWIGPSATTFRMSMSSVPCSRSDFWLSAAIPRHSTRACVERQGISRDASELLPLRGDLSRIEVGRDRGGPGARIHQADVAIGSHEINGIAPQAGPMHLRIPGKDVQWQFAAV